MQIKSFYPSAKKQIWGLLGRNLEAMSEHYVDTVREKIAIQGVPLDRRSYRDEPPRKETGALYEGFHAEIDKKGLVAFVGSDQPYALILEADPDQGEAGLDRPFIRSTLIQESAEMGRLGTQP